VRLTKDVWFKIEVALTGTLVAFGLGTVIYAAAGYFRALWRWLFG
jgi:hypothetical protein